MIDDRTKSCIVDAVLAEMSAAIQNHGGFHSHHEAWAVLREEVEEVEDCYMPFATTTSGAMRQLWDLIKMDAVHESDAKELIDEIYGAAEEFISECIQVMAMCHKWQWLIDGIVPDEPCWIKLMEPAQETVATPEEETEEKLEVHPEEKPETCPEKKPSGSEGGQVLHEESTANRKEKVDKGRIRALYEARWSVKDIADDVRCSRQTVYNQLNAMKLRRKE